MVVPPSWGDELVAVALLERLAGTTERQIIACSCPLVSGIVRHADRSGAPSVVVVAPPVAAARYVRLTYGEDVLITYVGDCPAASAPEIHARFSPAGFFASLERDGITLESQSDSIPDGESERWRRHKSVPGGLPALRWLGRPPTERVMREADEHEQLLGPPVATQSCVLVDLSRAAGCVCGGHRETIADGEPLRSTTPIVIAPAGIRLDDAASDASPIDGSTVETHAAPASMPASGASLSDERAAAGGQRVPVAEEPTNTVGDRPDVTVPNADHIAEGSSAEPAPTPAPVPDPAGTTKRSARSGASAAASRQSLPTPRQRRRERPGRVAALVGLTVSATLLVVALGGVTYRLVSSRTGSGRVIRPDTSTATARGTLATDSVSVGAAGARSASHITASDTGRLAASPPDTARRAPNAATRTDSAVRRPRPRRRPVPEVVPGWLPQGRPTWTPDTTRRRPDSTTSDTLRRP